MGNGINVVEPGGNGDNNTENLYWLPEESGAIVVGAGTASDTSDLKRHENSSYGPRFNVQAWGENIVTTGRGDLYGLGIPDSTYTATFGGTSGASAIVAGVVANFVGWWRAEFSGETPSPEEVREVLEATGTIQQFPPQGYIGPRPDLERAIDEGIVTQVDPPVAEALSNLVAFIVPNPANTHVSIAVANSEPGHLSIEVFNAAGRRIRSLASRGIEGGIRRVEWDGLTQDGRSVASGSYFVRIQLGNNCLTKKVLIVR